MLESLLVVDVCLSSLSLIDAKREFLYLKRLLPNWPYHIILVVSRYARDYSRCSITNIKSKQLVQFTAPHPLTFPCPCRRGTTPSTSLGAADLSWRRSW